MQAKLRTAQPSDIDTISTLIKRSARKLGGDFYDSNTIEWALKGAFGVDTQLIEDQSYYLLEVDTQLVACGGWSDRKTLFGSDNNKLRDPGKLNPATDAAKIRAFFIHPDYARRGLGKVLLNACEQAAQKHHFSKTELMSTLSGIQFYENNGYIGTDFIQHNMGDGQLIKFLPMHKQLL